MKSHEEMLFLQQLLDELGSWVGISTHLDYKMVEERVKTEGFSFLTITLPEFGKDFERCLELGYIPITSFFGFSKRKTKSTGEKVFPKFLGGFLEKVFDTADATLLSNPSIDAIRAIRQITLMFGKVALPCSPERVQKAFDGYIRCDEELQEVEERLFGSLQDPISRGLVEEFHRASRLLWRDIFTKIDRKIYFGEITPKHGSGSTADKILGNKKYLQTEWTERLEVYFSWTEFMYPSYSLALADEDVVVLRDPGTERPVKVIQVPKTLKTPRIIAMEPVCMQYIQQGLLEQFELEVRGNNLAASFIDWSSQTPNQEFARRGSARVPQDLRLDRSSTLDLSEASDRVSNQLVKLMLSDHPHLQEAVQSCRSMRADVNGKIINLTKFASMGSALCFPIEAMVFMTIIVVAVARANNAAITPALIRELKGKVRVYGDDIIVPMRYVYSVIQTLESFGLRVNRNKSFWNGNFRESCGKEYYDSSDVSIVRMRRMFPTSRKHVSELVSMVSLRNLLFKAGYETTVKWLDERIEKIIPFPFVEPTSPALGRWTHEPPLAERMHPHLQKPLVKAAVVVDRLPKSYLDGSGALMKFFLRRGVTPFNDVKHLERAGRPTSQTLKVGWTSIR